MSGITPTKIFNVDEPTGKEHSALETTAAEARINAPNPVVAHEVDLNADEVQHAAQQAAAHAKTMGSSFTGEPNTAVSASRVTNAAVQEGKHDVDEAKAIGAGYVQQAKDAVNSAMEMAQGYLPASVTSAASAVTNAASSAVARPGETASNVATAISDTVINTTSAAIGTMKDTASGAQAFVSDSASKTQTTVDDVSSYAQASANDAASRARATADNASNMIKQSAQPHIDKAMETAQSYANVAGTQGKQLHDQHMTGNTTGPASTKVPASATTAPLESGKHTVDTPYPNPSTKPGLASKVANPNEPTLAGSGAPTMLN